MIMCVLLCYPVSIRIYYQQGVLFLVFFENSLRILVGLLVSNGPNPFNSSTEIQLISVQIIFLFLNIHTSVYNYIHITTNLIKLTDNSFII